MNETFRKTIEACQGAAIPCTAWSTNGEVDEIISQAVEFSVKYGNKDSIPMAVYVWRESVGFEEYGALIDDGAEGKQQVTQLSHQHLEFLCDKIGDPIRPADDFPGATVPFAVQYILDYDYREEGRRALFVLRDWHAYIGANRDHIDRQLALFEDIAKTGGRHIIAIGQPEWTDDTIPVELNNYIHRKQLDLPSKSERQVIIENWRDQALTAKPDKFGKLAQLTDSDIEDLADACGGLTRPQTEAAILLSLSSLGTFDVSHVLNEKKEYVKQAGFLIDRPENGFERIGGLSPLKEWTMRLRKRFTKEAIEYGFTSYPKGLLMAGVPGCGKSALAKAIAREWMMNLLTVKAEDLKGSLVGESEAKVGRLLRTAKAAAPIILFVDEAEKLLGKSDGVNDGGAHDAVLGQFLHFMQEDDSGVFFIFTANNMEKFAPELVDRFEGRFFIDLPSASEREDILKIHLNIRKQNIEDFDISELVRKTKDFSGRNIEQGINDAMNISFDESRALVQSDLLRVFSEVIPTSKTKKADIETMRTFVENGMMRSANDIEETKSSSVGQMRAFD